MQIKGLKEYLIGNHPLLCYEKVRNSLRGHSHLNLSLNEIKIAKGSENHFPPRFYRKSKELETKFISTPPYDKFLGIPVLLWNPHTPLPLLSETKEN